VDRFSRPRGRPSTKKIVDYSETAVDEADEAYVAYPLNRHSKHNHYFTVSKFRMTTRNPQMPPKPVSTYRQCTFQFLHLRFTEPNYSSRPRGRSSARKILKSSESIDEGFEKP